MAGRAVHVAVGGTGDEGLTSGPLSGENEVVELDLPLGGAGPDDERPADLAAVSAVVRPEADGEEITFLDPAIGGPVAAQPRVGARPHGGGESRAVGTVVHEPALQLQGQVAFGASHEDRFEEFAERLVGDLRGDPQAGDLLLVLHQAQLFHGAAEVAEAQARGDGAHGAVAGDRQVVFLDGQGVGVQAAGETRRGDDRVAVGIGQDGQPQLLVGAPVGGVPGRRAGQSRTSSPGPSSSTAPGGAPPAR